MQASKSAGDGMDVVVCCGGERAISDEWAMPRDS